MQIIKRKQSLYPSILFYILLLFIFFDGIRSNLIIGSYLSLVREATVALLFIYSLRKKMRCRYLGQEILLWPFYVYHIFVCIMTFLLPGYVQMSFVIRPFYVVIGILLFYNYENLTGKSYAYLLTLCTKIAVVFVFLDILFYFVRIPIFRPDTTWWGRISSGYPTMDVVTLAYSLLILLFYRNLKINDYVRTLCIIVVLVGMVVQFTGTGIVLIALILGCAIIYYLMSHKFKSNKYYFYCFVIICLVSGSALTYVSKNYSMEYRNGYFLIQNKLDILLGKETDINTLDIRKEQYIAEQRKMSGLEWFIGKSLANATNDGDALAHSRQTFMIEDQYNLNKICYGYLGFSLFILMIASIFLYFVRQKISVENKILLCLSVVVFAINSKTLISLVLFPNHMFFALLVGYGLKQSILNKLENDKTKRCII